MTISTGRFFYARVYEHVFLSPELGSFATLGREASALRDMQHSRGQGLDSPFPERDGRPQLGAVWSEAVQRCGPELSAKGADADLERRGMAYGVSR